MEAIVLAAGLGTRLRPLTDHVPKPLVEVGGVAMLERVARRLVGSGARRLVINTHHHPEQIESFVREKEAFGVEVRFSREPGDAPLGTGGGIQQAAGLLGLEAPFFVHNADVVTELSLDRLYDSHEESALATLAVTEVETRSPLLVDDLGVVGVRYPSGAVRHARDARGPVREVAFCGVSVLSPELPSLLTERGAFSIISAYLRLIAEGRIVRAHDIGGAFWTDIGTHERLAEADRAVRRLAD